MNIYFYLNTEDETEIVTFHDLESNPFKLGDEVNLSINELYPAEYSKYNDHYKKVIIEDNEELRRKFNRKNIKLVWEGKYINFKTAQKPSITIEYHCDIVER